MSKILKSKEPEQITEPAENRKTLYELSQEAKAKDSTIRREISVFDIAPFPDNPYKVIENEDMNELTESIRKNGILTPLMVRSLEDETYRYELISGHRRLYAAKKAGLETVPAFVYAIGRDEAAIMVVDSNLHREHILPSEKAFAYKLKYEAMKRQGYRTDLTSGQVVPKSEDNRTTAQIGEENGESYKTVQRYIRLTNLIPELLELMDENKIAFSVGVELSYLDEDTQYELLGIMEETDHKPSYAQANKMHKEFVAGNLTGDGIQKMLSADKPNQREKISLFVDEIQKYFNKDTTPKEMQAYILKLLEADVIRKRNARSRGEAR